jgi:hypothetical protein
MSSGAAHTTKIITMGNGGAKARRAVCSCGHLGVRFPFMPGGRTIAQATAKAEAEATSAEWAAHQ